MGLAERLQHGLNKPIDRRGFNTGAARLAVGLAAGAAVGFETRPVLGQEASMIDGVTLRSETITITGGINGPESFKQITALSNPEDPNSLSTTIIWSPGGKSHLEEEQNRAAVAIHRYNETINRMAGLGFTNPKDVFTVIQDANKKVTNPILPVAQGGIPHQEKAYFIPRTKQNYRPIFAVPFEERVALTVKERTIQNSVTVHDEHLDPFYPDGTTWKDNYASGFFRPRVEFDFLAQMIKMEENERGVQPKDPKFHDGVDSEKIYQKVNDPATRVLALYQAFQRAADDYVVYRALPESDRFLKDTTVKDSSGNIVDGMEEHFMPQWFPEGIAAEINSSTYQNRLKFVFNQLYTDKDVRSNMSSIIQNVLDQIAPQK